MSTKVTIFDGDDNRLGGAMARGHRARKGHELEGWHVTTDDGHGFPLTRLVRSCCPAPVDDLYTVATQHDVIRQIALAECCDTHDRWGTIMSIGFTICDALTLRGEYVPLGYRPAMGDLGEQMRDDFDTLDAEEAEAKYPDHGDLYFAWGLGLDRIPADDLRDYLTGPWQAAYDALEGAGEDY